MFTNAEYSQPLLVPQQSNISPLPIHGHCHCGQFKIPVVSTCMSLGYVAMKNRVRLQAETNNLRASFSKYGGLMLWR